LEVLLSEFVAELKRPLILKCSHYFLDAGIKFAVSPSTLSIVTVENRLITTVDLGQLLVAQERNYPPNLRVAESSKDL
jgi:hypothetical protein